MNPRFVRYCQTYGLAPDHDRMAVARSTTTPVFTSWMAERWREWCALAGKRLDLPKSPDDHAAFDEWLNTWSRP